MSHPRRTGWLALGLFLGVATGGSAHAAPKVELLDAGSFLLNMPVDREQWSVEVDAPRQWITLRFLQSGPIRLGSVASYHVFAERVDPPADRAKLAEFFGAYLKRKDTPLIREVFRGTRTFRADPKQHAIGEDSALLRFDMPKRAVMDAAVGGSTGYVEHAVVFIYIPPGFSAHGSFVTFVGVERINPSLGHKSRLTLVESMLRSFQWRGTVSSSATGVGVETDAHQLLDPG